MYEKPEKLLLAYLFNISKKHFTRRRMIPFQWDAILRKVFIRFRMTEAEIVVPMIHDQISDVGRITVIFNHTTVQVAKTQSKFT